MDCLLTCCVVLLITYACLVDLSYTLGGCQFDHLASECKVKLGRNGNATLHLSINRCHDPVDVTAIVQLSESRNSWKHTFANRDEEMRLDTLRRSNIHLHMAVQHNKHNSSIYIQASFTIDGFIQAPVINSTVSLPSKQDCDKDGDFHDMAGIVILVVFLVLVAFIIILASAFLCVKRTSHSMERGALFDNVDTRPAPYQEDPNLSQEIIPNSYLAVPGNMFPKPGSASSNGSFSKYVRKNKGSKEPTVRRSVELCFGDDETPFTDL